MLFFNFIVFSIQSNDDLIEEYDLDSNTIIKLDPSVTEIILGPLFENSEIKIIGSRACNHSNCTLLNLSNTRITFIKKEAFYHAPIKTLILPDSLQVIEYDAFRGIQINSLTIPLSLQNFDGAFNYCGSLVSFIKDPDNQNFFIHKNIVYSDNRTKIVRASVKAQFEDIEFINETVTLAQYSFSRGEITRFEGHSKLASIGYGAFESCLYLKDVNLVQTSITKIMMYCFKGSVINFLVLPPNIQEIQQYAFDQCNIVSLFLPSSITNIKWGAFFNQKGDLRVFYFGKKSFDGRQIFSVKDNGSIKIFVPTSYEYNTLAGIPVTICSIDEMFVPPNIIRCTIEPCRCFPAKIIGISLMSSMCHK